MNDINMTSSDKVEVMQCAIICALLLGCVITLASCFVRVEKWHAYGKSTNIIQRLEIK